MKNLIVLGAALAATALSSITASAADATYVRGSTAWFEPVASESFDGALGGLVAFGQTFGVHNIEAEIGYVNFSASESFYGITGSADLEVIPVTIGYRYDLKLTDKLNLGLGANTGFAITQGSLSVTVPGVGSGSFSDTDTVWVASGGLRLSYALTETVTLSAGYRYLLVDDISFSFEGVPVKLEDNNTHAFEIGAEYRW